VTFDDLATGLQRRFREMGKDGTLTLKPFSLDIIVHSTGGPVVRHWLNYYLTDVCKGDLARCPVRSLIMLAPANFGSRLAAQGKSALAKLFKGGMEHGFQTGKRILEGLELGSPVLWRIADGDLFAGERRYPCTPKGPFVYVMSGSDTYGHLKGLVAKGANENGSDGTIRAAAASLNSIKIQVDSLLSKLAGIQLGDRAISWGYWTRSARAEIRLPGSAVPISQGPAPPVWR